MPAQVAVLGHVTRDLIGGETRLGGAASYAARVASALGCRTTVVTTAPPGDALLKPLVDDANIELHVQPSPVMTTFELCYQDGARTLRLCERASNILIAQIPASVWRCSSLYIAPVMGECPVDLLNHASASLVVAGLQGWLRTTDKAGAVLPIENPNLNQWAPRIHVGVFSEEDHPNAEALAKKLGSVIPAVLLTHGRGGVTIFRGSEKTWMAAPEVRAVDPTGAGDTFGIVLQLGLAGGLSLEQAATQAMRAAALLVQGPELGRLHEMQPLFVSSGTQC